MVDKSNLYNEKWFDGTFKRILAQVDIIDDWNKLLKMADKSKVEIGAVVSTRGSADKIPKKIKYIEILSVSPGPSGQKFDKDALYIIEHFKKAYPYATILVDGGVNLSTGRLSANAGASVLVSTSYIWKSNNPYDTYKALSFL